MQFGVVMGPALPSRSVVPSREAFEFAASMAEVARDSGFNTIGVANKSLPGPAHQFLNPIATAAYLHTKHPNLFVCTSIFLVPYTNPVLLAEQLATLDMLAPGKLLFGVGQGYRKNESIAFDVPDEERGRRMTEALKIIRMLFEDGAPSFDGEFWSFENADIGIKPDNRSGPPMLFAGDKPKAIARIPERGGDYWFPSARCSLPYLREGLDVFKAALDRAGKPYKGLPLIRDICVAESKEAAEALMRDSITDYLNRQSTWGQPGERYDLSFDELKHNRFILGNSEQAAEEVVALKREFDTDFILFRVYTPGMDMQRTTDVVRQVGTEVLPMVQKEVGDFSMF